MMRSASATMNHPLHDSDQRIQSKDDSYPYQRGFHDMMRPEMATFHREGLSHGRQGYSQPWARNSNVPEGQSDIGSPREVVTPRFQLDRTPQRLYKRRSRRNQQEEVEQTLRELMAGRTFVGEPDSQPQSYISDGLGIPRDNVSQRSLQEQQEGLQHIPLFCSTQDLGRAGMRQRGVTGAFEPRPPQPSARPWALNPSISEPYSEGQSPRRSQASTLGHNLFRKPSEPYPQGHNPFRSLSEPYPERQSPSMSQAYQGYNPFRSPSEPYPERQSPPKSQVYPQGHTPFRSLSEPYPERQSPPKSQACQGHNLFRSLAEPHPEGQSACLTRNLPSGSEPLQPYHRTSSSSEVDELFETLHEPRSTEVLVKGVSKKTSRETLRMYFENTTRSGGGPITNLRFDKTTGRCRVSFQSTEDARNVVSKGEHVVDEKKITVTVDQPAVVSVSSQQKVVVQDFETTTTTEELLRTYFEDPARSGGGKVTRVSIFPSKRGSAVVCFENEKDARNVTTREHVLNWKPLRVCLCEESYALSSVFCLSGLKGSLRILQDLAEDLVHFVESKWTHCPVYDVCFGSKSVQEGTALIIFEDDLHMLDLQNALAATDFQGHKLSVRSVSVSRTVEVHNLPLSPTLCEDTLINYFENTRQSGGQNVLEVHISRNRDYALVTFADPEVCRNVVNRSQVLRNVELHVQTYFDCVGTSLAY